MYIHPPPPFQNINSEMEVNETGGSSIVSNGTSEISLAMLNEILWETLRSVLKDVLLTIILIPRYSY